MSHTPAKSKKQMHGVSKARGCSHLELGSFSRMFCNETSWAEDLNLEDKPEEVERIAALLGGINGVMHDTRLSTPDSCVPAAYTFFAQFIDHDVTLDTTSDLHGGPTKHQLNFLAGCPHAHGGGSNPHTHRLPNLRSASLDLDCVYGFGPEASPHLYDDSQPGRLLVGNKENPNDVPRNRVGTALIGDPRNDENIFVSQVQLLFLKFHNKRLVGKNFEEAQQDVRYHYQYLVWNDFLKRVCDEAVFDFANTEIHKAVKRGEGFPKFKLVDDCGRITMPVEFSVAAYRFGHSLVRSIYPINADYPAIELFDERFGTEGFSAVPKALTVDWSFLLDVSECQNYVMSKSIDHLLTDELIRLPNPVVGKFASENDRSLAFRNLLRGYVLHLPSGQKVASALQNSGYPINGLSSEEIEAVLAKKFEASMAKKLSKHTPLFFYITLESSIKNNGKRLGSVGSAILTEVFGTMLLHCNSFLKSTLETNRCDTTAEDDIWQPDACLRQNGDFTLADVVRYVQ